MATDYTNTLQVVRVTGIGVEVFDEVVGTGDDSETSFDLDNGNVITGSYTLSHGATGSNDLTALTETTHYTISKDEGRVELTVAGVAALSTDILYASYTHSPKMSDSIIATYLAAAEDEVEKKTGNYWGTSKETTEYFSNYDTDYPSTEEPFATSYDEPDFVVLKNRGCIDLESVDFLTRGGATVTEESIALTSVYLDTESSTVTFLNNNLPNGTNNIKIVYNHGYASVDPQISELTAYFVGLRVYAFITGGSYDDATGFTLGRMQVSIGEVYVNVREVARQFETRIESILNDVGRKMDVM